MAVLERGGNAFDAACAAGFVLQVVEPHLNGPGGDLPAVFWSAERGEPLVLCAQGVSPAAATIERYRSLGHELVPGTGLLAACVPGVVRRLAAAAASSSGRGGSPTSSSSRSATPSDGYPVVPGITCHDRARRAAAARLAGSAELYLPAPRAGLDVPQSAAGGDLAAPARRVARRLARGRDRARAAGLLRGLRRRGDRPVLARARRPADGRRPGARGARRSSRRPPSTTAG